MHFRSSLRCAVVLLLCLGAICAPKGEARELQSKVPLALETFDEVWRILNENHFDTNFNGHDWARVREDYRPRAIAAQSTAAFHDVVEEMLGLLAVSHLAIVPGEFAEVIGGTESDSTGLEEADESESGTVGLEVRYAGKHLLVTSVEPNSPAAQAGVKSGWIVKQIGTVSTAELKKKLPEKLDEQRRDFLAWRAAANRLSGAPESTIAIEFQDGRGATRRLRLTRATTKGEPIQFGPLPVIYAHLTSEKISTPRRQSIGLLRFNIWMLPAALAFNKAVDQHRQEAGLVIDLRGNVGGMVGMIIGVSGHFTREPIVLGTMIDRVNKLRLPANPRWVDSSGKRVEPYAGPVAILVDEITASASEVFAGGLQEHGRVRVFGRTTAGQALPALYDRLPNGDTLYRPIADFITPKGVRFEGRGVVPDESVPLNRNALLAGRDLALERALAWIDGARK